MIILAQCDCCEWGRFFRQTPVPVGTEYDFPMFGKVAIRQPRPHRDKALLGLYLVMFGRIFAFTPFKVRIRTK